MWITRFRRFHMAWLDCVRRVAYFYELSSIRASQPGVGGLIQDAVDKGWLRLEPSHVGGEADLRLVAETAFQIASAMKHVHASGLIHGDLTGLSP